MKYLWPFLLALPATAQDFAAPSDADYLPVNTALAALGRDLFYDPILSGNRNISCATCHHPNLATADGVSLSLGEGAIGLGRDRHVGVENAPEDRIPRNAPALFNLGAREFTVMFHDGRLELDPSRPSGLRSPVEGDMVGGFNSVLSAQTMFPVLSADEMAGHYSENEVSRAVRQGFITGEGGAWALISARVSALPAYRDGFAAAVPAIAQGRPLDFTDISNALADFMAFEWRADQSLFDRWLRGEAQLSAEQDAGRKLFYGAAGCAACHSGRFQTNHQFHAIGMPQLGPGKAAAFEDHFRDEGRFRVTGQTDDLYAFRTPSLRNVAQTAPYGHAGAFATLEGIVRHHLGVVDSFANYDQSQAVLLQFEGEDWAVMDGADAAAIIAANSLAPIELEDEDVSNLLEFLATLTDQSSIDGRLGIPDAVPSGLPIDR